MMSGDERNNNMLMDVLRHNVCHARGDDNL
jgi:hypothetical protein